ncbi:MAG: hypothetical protein ACYC6C_01070 [Coriobacteriia bacterium]
MNVRKWSVIGMLAGMLAIGGLAFAASPLAGGIFLALLGGFALVHAVLLCSKCENDCCALNPTSPDFVFGRPRSRSEVHDPGDNRWVPFALLITLPFGIWGAWEFSIPGLVAALVLIAVAFTFYREKTCRHCTNPCPVMPRNV